MRADFEVTNKAGRRVAVVETKVRRGTSWLWAQATRDNVQPPDDVLFILATPSALYFWEPTGEKRSSPSHDLLAESLLQPYLERVGLSADDVIRPEVFELVVQTLLLDIVAGRSSLPTDPPWLGRLLEPLRGGTIGADVAA